MQLELSPQEMANVFFLPCIESFKAIVKIDKNLEQHKHREECKSSRLIKNNRQITGTVAGTARLQ